jgi:hypothetical protein
MTLVLLHPQSQILHQWLSDTGFDSDPLGHPWKLTYAFMPDQPDEIVTVFDTDGKKGGRAQVTGEMFEHLGFQIQVRSLDLASGYNKIVAIATAMDREVLRTPVAINCNEYRVQAISRQGPVSNLGFESPRSARRLFSINGLVSISRES